MKQPLMVGTRNHLHSHGPAECSSPSTVLLIEGEGADEFFPVTAFLRSVSLSINLRQVTGIAPALALPDNEGWFPDLIVVAQSWPDQYPTAEVLQLLATFPLARLVCCYGCWCDSDGRNRAIWPPGARIAAEHAPARIARELELLAANGRSDRLPLTASRTEVFEHDYSDPPPQPAAPRTVCVISPDRAWSKMLERALAARGDHVLPLTHDAHLDRIHWDADPWNEDRRDELQSLHRQCRETPITAWVGFPRPDLLSELTTNGAAAVAFKLGPLTQLIPSQ